MELLVALVCEDARARDDGRLDVHGVLHDLYAPGFPALQDRMVLALVVEWARSDEGRFRFRVDLVDEGDTRILTVDGHTDVDRRPPHRPPARTQLVVPLEQVVFPSPGRYRFRVTLKGKRLPGPPLLVMETAELGSGAES